MILVLEHHPFSSFSSGSCITFLSQIRGLQLLSLSVKANSSNSANLTPIVPTLDRSAFRAHLQVCCNEDAVGLNAFLQGERIRSALQGFAVASSILAHRKNRFFILMYLNGISWKKQTEKRNEEKKQVFIKCAVEIEAKY